MRRVAMAVLTVGLTGAVAAGCGPAMPAQYYPSGNVPILSRVGPWATPTFAHNYSITGEHFSAPAVGDFWGNGHQEVAAGYPDGYLRVFDPAKNGQVVYSFYTGPGAVHSSPVVTDVNKDGHLDLVVSNTSGDIWGVTPSTGQQFFHQHIGNGQTNNGAFATPAVADILNNGVNDIVETGWDQMLHVWSTRWDGRTRTFPELPGFPLHLQDTSWSSPAVADINHDGKKEIVFGYDCDGAPGQYCRTRYNSYGGFVTVIRPDGTIQPGWPRFVPHQVIWSTPAVADLTGTGQLDVVVGTGNMPATMYDGGQQKMDGGNVVNAYVASTGATLPGWPARVAANATGSPAVGDLNGDGKKETVEIAEDGRLSVLDSTGATTAITCVADSFTSCPHWLHSSVSIADVFGDGHQQIVVGGEQWLDVYSYHNGSLQLLARGWVGYGPVAHQFTAAPTVANVNGKASVLVATDADMPSGGAAGVLYDWVMPNPLGRADWPTFKHDMARNGHN